MRAKDTARLSVLRGLLAEITNSSKTNRPINDDAALYVLLKKRLKATQASIQEFYEADRKDLVAKETEQMDVLQEYTKNVGAMSDEEVRAAVEKVAEEQRRNGKQFTVGLGMKECSMPGGPFDGKVVDQAEIAKHVKAVAAAAGSA